MNSTNESLKTITKGAGILFVGIFISKLLTYIYRIIVARIGTEQYGLLSLGIAILGILTTLSLLGLNRGVLRYISFYKGKQELLKIKNILSSTFKITLPLSSILAIFLFIFSNRISVTFFHNPNLSIIIKIIAIAIPFNVFREILFSTLRAFQKIRYEVYAKNIIENISKIILTLIFLVLGLSIIGATISYTLSILFSAILAFYFLEKKVFSFFKNKADNFFNNKELLTYSLPLLFSNFIFSLILWTDTLMIGYFLPESEVGIYNAALPTAFLMWMIPQALLILFIPILTEFYAQNKYDEFKNVYKTVTKWIFVINLILLSIFYLFSKSILGILFGSAYITGAISLIILGTGYFIGFLTSSSQDILLILKKTKLILFNTTLMAIGNIILNLYLIPIYGITGAAIATSSIFILRSILLTIESYLIKKIIPFKLNYIKILFSISIASILIKYISKFYPINIFTLMINGILLLGFYSLFLLITKSFEKEDIMIIKTMQQKIGIDFTKINRFLSKFIK